MAAIDFSSARDITDFLKIWLRQTTLSDAARKLLDDYYKKWRGLDAHRLCHWYRNQVREIEALIADGEQPRLLEIGVGSGTEALWFAWLGADVTGIDVLPYEVDVANERLGILEQQSGRTLNCDMRTCPVLQFTDSEGFDVIWLEQAFHHLEPRAEVVAKLSELLRPGGKIVFSEANALNPLLQLQIFMQRGFKTTVEVQLDGHTTIWGNERILSAAALQKALATAGIRKTELRYFRLFPSHAMFDSLFWLEKWLTAVSHVKILAPIYSHYNFVGVKS